MITPDQHLTHLGEFITGVDNSGGTTPHVAMTVEAMRSLPTIEDKLWFAGMYSLVYNWAGAERLFLDFPYSPEPDPEGLETYFRDHRKGLPIRKERKAIYRVGNFVSCVETYRAAVPSIAGELLAGGYSTHEEAFQALTGRVKYMGRYIGIRWVEVIRRAFGGPLEMTSIVSDGGEHPRKALSLIYPQHAGVLLGGNDARTVASADAIGEAVLLDLALSGVQTDYYQLQSLLCEYKQQVLGRKHYPGKSIDSEVDYFDKVYAYWGEDKAKESRFWEIRRAIFPEYSLGEVQGWHGVRKPLLSLLVDHGYTWSDHDYDYVKTQQQGFASPVRRTNAEVS